MIKGVKPGRYVALSVAILVGWASSLAIGQIKKSNELDNQAAYSQQNFSAATKSPSNALEGTIDPKTYVLGSGDQLEFDVWGPFESRIELTVAPDGLIAAPTVGELHVAGLTLFEADSLFRIRAKSSYPRAETVLRLLAVRRMKASITGAVKMPGTYELSAIDRLSTLVNLAGGLLLPDEETKQQETIRDLTATPRSAQERRTLQQVSEAKLQRPQASIRHITIISKAGRKQSIDLQKFYVTGDLTNNPVIRDGDVVNTPILNREIGVINIFGSVKSPGEYEFREGDHLKDAVDIAGGFRQDALTDAITLIRFDANGANPTEIKTALKELGDSGILLQADDRIFVRKKSDFRQKYQVVVKGEVLYPGAYPIDEESTRLSDVVKASGGLTDQANLYSARVFRRSTENMDDPEFERLKTLSIGEMTEMEYEYFKIRSREESPSVVVSFSKLFVQGDSSQDILLQDKDEIEIPTLSPTVKVAGQVNSPGLVRYKEGEGYEYYIGKAGGYSWNARKGKMRLIKAHSGMWIKPRKQTPIEIGDTIFVPEKQETDWWAVSKDMLLAVSQIATVLIMIRSL